MLHLTTRQSKSIYRKPSKTIKQQQHFRATPFLIYFNLSIWALSFSNI